MDFYSEYLEDLWLRLHAKLPDKGVYVDCGCYHPRIASNTAHLRDSGWRGLVIDANRNLAAVWEKHPEATFVCCLLGDGAPAKYAVHPTNPGWSKVGDGDETPTRTIESVLAEHGIGKIDVLSLDLEGMEFAVLQSLDLDKHAPTWIISEYNTEGIGKDYRVLEHLVRNDYVALHMTAANIIYQRANKQKPAKVA